MQIEHLNKPYIFFSLRRQTPSSTDKNITQFNNFVVSDT